MREEKIKRMRQISSCFVCQKRSGCWYYDCSTSSHKVKRHSSGKIVRQRECKSWKHNRKTQWK